MKNQIAHTEQKLQFLKHACINCHPTMKAYYQKEYAKWNKILTNLKENGK